MKNLRSDSRRPKVEELEGRLVPASFSSNWSGYAIDVNPGTVTVVSGSWVVPAVSGTGTSYSSAWVGIDGDNSNSVEQIGTDSDVANGKATYYAWYEMYPLGSVNLNLKVKPGDVISAKVSYASNAFTLQISDSDGGQSYSTTKKASGAERSSAEWIQEAPSIGSGVATLANFGTISFSNAQATIGSTKGAIDNPAWASGDDEIDMQNRSGATDATPSTLTDSGSPSASGSTSSFSVKFNPTSTTTTPPSSRFGGFTSVGLGGLGFGGWGWFSWRQTNMALSSVNGNTSLFGDVPQLAPSSARSAIAQSSLTILSTGSPFTSTPSFSSGSQGLASSFASSLSSVGGSSDQPAPQTPADAADPTMPPAVVPPAPTPSTEAMPVAPLPSRVESVKVNTPMTDAWRWTPAVDGMPALIDQHEDATTVADYRSCDPMLSLAVAGVVGIATGQVSAGWRKQQLDTDRRERYLVSIR